MLVWGRKATLRGGFSNYKGWCVETIVYIDGYNLYYGRLKGTPYKWFDLYRLSEILLHEQVPDHKLIKVKYFTALVKTKFATHGIASQQAQDSYHRALTRLYPLNVEIIYGAHSTVRDTPLIYKKPPQLDNRTEVWKIEEKMTDVNIALHAYRDVIKGNCKRVVLISNDADQVPLLEAINAEHNHPIDIGVIFPLHPATQGKPSRPTSKTLGKLAHWTRNAIPDIALEAAQLPEQIPTNKKPIRRPDYW
jgi:uncharacterized LabA/DUF88 family protein